MKLTIRDQFAMAALTGMLSMETSSMAFEAMGQTIGISSALAAARTAYELADAMLEEKKKRDILDKCCDNAVHPVHEGCEGIPYEVKA